MLCPPPPPPPPTFFLWPFLTGGGGGGFARSVAKGMLHATKKGITIKSTRVPPLPRKRVSLPPHLGPKGGATLAQTHATSYVKLIYTVKEKGGNLRENHTPFPVGLRNPFRNIKSENCQDYAQKNLNEKFFAASMGRYNYLPPTHFRYCARVDHLPYSRIGIIIMIR